MAESEIAMSETIISSKYDFSLFFDVENGNPNGDPDAGNLPRVDPETGLGIVSDVCIKRKVRNYVDLVKGVDVDAADADEGELGYKIYVQQDAVLNDRNRLAYRHFGKDPDADGRDLALRGELERFMCANFFDIRAFGAVMTTSVNCGQVKGPIQICFGQSVDPVMPLEMSITRMARTKEEEGKENRTMGSKQYIPYGLYRVNGSISACLAEKTGFSESDLRLFLDALMGMFEVDRSAARGLMTSRKLVVFRHDSKLGNAPSKVLYDLVVARNTLAPGEPVRSYGDYDIEVARDLLPKHVAVEVTDYDNR